MRVFPGLAAPFGGGVLSSRVHIFDSRLRRRFLSGQVMRHSAERSYVSEYQSISEAEYCRPKFTFLTLDPAAVFKADRSCVIRPDRSYVSEYQVFSCTLRVLAV
jgi:hypothetical protein